MNEATRKNLRSWARRITIDLAIIYLGLCAIGLFMINGLMFRPHAPGYSWDTPHVVNVGDDATPVAAMWLPSTTPGKTVLYSHGNGEDLGDLTEIFEAFRKAGFSVLGYDYPGYGLSAGKPTEKSAYAAADTAYRFLTTRHGTAPADILALGRSLGSGPACYLAERHPLGGLIIESGFTSAPRVMTRIRLLPFDPFPNIRRIPNISAPKLFIHGMEDRVIPYTHSQTLFAAAAPPKTHRGIGGAGHDDLMFVIGDDAYFKLLQTFTDP